MNNTIYTLDFYAHNRHTNEHIKVNREYDSREAVTTALNEMIRDANGMGMTYISFEISEV